ncbi:hypothetical protein UF64_09605 [Thalassospira sp. HJ]|nr:hypothetical protein UF64_09605 [Thalassospira sp. HJ]
MDQEHIAREGGVDFLFPGPGLPHDGSYTGNLIYLICDVSLQPVTLDRGRYTHVCREGEYFR